MASHPSGRNRHYKVFIKKVEILDGKVSVTLLVTDLNDRPTTVPGGFSSTFDLRREDWSSQMGHDVPPDVSGDQEITLTFSYPDYRKGQKFDLNFTGEFSRSSMENIEISIPDIEGK